MAYDIGPLDSGGHLGARRLLALADYLETVPDENYDQTRWREVKPGCGTICCAFGHAVEGLGEQLGIKWFGVKTVIPRLGNPGRWHHNIDAAAEVFELDLGDALQLFGGGDWHAAQLGLSYEHELTPARVARNIRAFALAKLQVKENVNAV